MKSIKLCEYSRSISFHDDLMFQDQVSDERFQDQWSSGFLNTMSYTCISISVRVSSILSLFPSFEEISSNKTDSNKA